MTTQIELQALAASTGPQGVIDPSHESALALGFAPNEINVADRFANGLEQMQQPFVSPNVDSSNTIEPRGFFTRGELISTGHIGDLTKAQGDFISEQTLFLENGGSSDSEGYTSRLQRYSFAQSRLSRAQGDILRQLGII